MNLTTQEKKVLLAVHDGASTPDSIASRSGLSRDTVFTAIERLKDKGLISVDETVYKIVELTDEGKKYKAGKLPEEELLEALRSGVNDVKTLSKQPWFKIGAVWLARLGVAKISNGRFDLLEDVDTLPTRRLLDYDGKKLGDIPADDQKLIKSRRAIFEIKDRKQITVSLTDEGEALVSKGLEIVDEVSDLTPELLKTGKWRNAVFRKYDVTAKTPPVFPGRRHFAVKAMDYIRQIWLEMGFKEMNGPIINTSFWNFDALFVPQDHPARELQDTFYISPDSGDLPDSSIVSRVKKAHEEGVSGSRGWNYAWSEEEARRLVLRTHTTVLSARTLAKLKQGDLPAKFFSVGRVFRNETLDWKHLFEFTQSEGIVVSEDANFRHLLGYLKQFLSKLGFDKVRFRPHYFPYTEMSVEPEVYHPVRKEWVELGGAGIFRPEVVEPLLGKDVPVLAWGLGVERLIVDKYGITDLRDIYKNDVSQLREIQEWWL